MISIRIRGKIFIYIVITRLDHNYYLLMSLFHSHINIFVRKRDKQLKENKKSATVEEMAPIWIANESSCQVCHKEFTLLFRRHHCRNWSHIIIYCIYYTSIIIRKCNFFLEFLFYFYYSLSGKCVCEICSRDKVRIPRIDAYKLFKVCNPCALEIKDSRSYGF